MHSDHVLIWMRRNSIMGHPVTYVSRSRRFTDNSLKRDYPIVDISFLPWSFVSDSTCCLWLCWFSPAAFFYTLPIGIIQAITNQQGIFWCLILVIALYWRATQSVWMWLQSSSSAILSLDVQLRWCCSKLGGISQWLKVCRNAHLLLEFPHSSSSHSSKFLSRSQTGPLHENSTKINVLCPNFRYSDSWDYSIGCTGLISCKCLLDEMSTNDSV